MVTRNFYLSNGASHLQRRVFPLPSVSNIKTGLIHYAPQAGFPFQPDTISTAGAFNVILVTFQVNNSSDARRPVNLAQ